MRIGDFIVGAAAAFGVPRTGILGPTRTRESCAARWAVMMLARREGFATTQIGRKLNRDHTTIIWGDRRGRELVAADDDYAAKVAETLRLAREAAELRATISRPELKKFRDWLLVGSERRAA